MADRPIPFSALMVDALIAGTKTQTRRIFTPPLPFAPDDDISVQVAVGSISAKAKVGDRLWVREAYFQLGHWEPIDGAVTRKGQRQKWRFVADAAEILFDAPAAYRKGRHAADPATPAWHKRLGRFMPRRASRMTLTVTAVRIERLQDISEADARAEGAYIAKASGRVSDSYIAMAICGVWFATARAWYASLWDGLNGDGAWDANPWVVAYTFTVERRNIDEVAT